jgi:hypothetical protein
MAKKKINVKPVEQQPQSAFPEGFHITVSGLPTKLKVRKDGTTGWALHLMYGARSIRYDVGPFSDDGRLDMWLPRVEQGEVQFRLVDETDPDDPKAVASGSV